GMQRLALGIARDAPFRGGPFAVGPPRPHADLVEKPERIGSTAAVRAETAGAVCLAAVHAHFPGGAMAGDRFLLIARDRILAHSGEEIVGLVVFAHMMEAEAPVFALAQPALGGAVRRALVAPWPVAARTVGAHAPILAGPDPDAVEQGR